MQHSADFIIFWQVDGKRAFLAGGALYGYLTAMCLSDVFDNGKAQPGFIRHLIEQNSSNPGTKGSGNGNNGPFTASLSDSRLCSDMVAVFKRKFIQPPNKWSAPLLTGGKRNTNIVKKQKAFDLPHHIRVMIHDLPACANQLSVGPLLGAQHPNFF